MRRYHQKVRPKKVALVALVEGMGHCVPLFWGEPFDDIVSCEASTLIRGDIWHDLTAFGARFFQPEAFSMGSTFFFCSNKVVIYYWPNSCRRQKFSKSARYVVRLSLSSDRTHKSLGHWSSCSVNTYQNSVNPALQVTGFTIWNVVW